VAKQKRAAQKKKPHSLTQPKPKYLHPTPSTAGIIFALKAQTTPIARKPVLLISGV
jgi:hypothetical protein